MDERAVGKYVEGQVTKRMEDGIRKKHLLSLTPFADDVLSSCLEAGGSMSELASEAIAYYYWNSSRMLAAMPRPEMARMRR